MANLVDSDEQQGEVARWVQEIKLYEREASGWTERSKKIIRRYKDDRGPRELKKRFNILWSNVQTLLPAVYDRPPTPNVERRFRDDDKTGMVAADVLERCASYFIKEDQFNNVMEQVVIDRLLVGRGTAWVRYVPNFKDNKLSGNEEILGEGVQLTDDVYSEPEPELYSEEVVFDYVHWQDFGHTWARTWEEVRAVWKKVYLDKKELKERFPEIADKIPLDYSPEKLNEEKVNDRLKKATVYEIWDKPSKRVIWIHKDVQMPLDMRDDPLGLRGFFPCPKPLFSTVANDTIIPVPDYIEYQDQALELDELTARINALTKAIKAAGVYDSSAEGVQQLLAEGVENTLVPVSQWAVFAEKGGLKGVVDFLPIDVIMNALLGLYQARENVKQDLYEITGISDIIRGASKASETATAQQIKGQYANLRLGKMQQKCEVFTRDLVRICAEIVSEHFSLETIKDISGVKLLSAQEKQMIQLGLAGQMSGLPQDQLKMQELMNKPSWEEVYGLISNDSQRCFRVDIETDSTIKADQNADRDARTQLIASITPMMQQIAQVADPDMKAVFMEILKFGVRGYKVGKDIEGLLEIVTQKAQQAAQQPQPQEENQEQENPQIEAMKAKAEMDLKAQELALKRDELAFEREKAQASYQIELGKLQLDAAKMNQIGVKY